MSRRMMVRRLSGIATVLLCPHVIIPVAPPFGILFKTNQQNYRDKKSLWCRSCWKFGCSSHAYIPMHAGRETQVLSSVTHHCSRTISTTISPKLSPTLILHTGCNATRSNPNHMVLKQENSRLPNIGFAIGFIHNRPLAAFQYMYEILIIPQTGFGKEDVVATE